MVIGWWLAVHAQTNPSGRVSPVDLTEAVGAGGFAAVGVSAVAMGLPYRRDFLPLGTVPGAVSSRGTIPLISFFVGLEVAAAFILIVGLYGVVTGRDLIHLITCLNIVQPST